MKPDSRYVATYLSTGLRHQQNLIRLADTKANIVLAFIGVVLSIFFGQFMINNNISSMQMTIILIPFLISGFFGLLTLYPSRGKVQKKSNSLFYFKEAKALNTSKKSNEITGNQGQEKIIEDFIESIKSLSAISEKKFKNLRFSYLFLALGVLIKLFIEAVIWIG
jgi:hypothetical protein